MSGKGEMPLPSLKWVMWKYEEGQKAVQAKENIDINWSQTHLTCKLEESFQASADESFWNNFLRESSVDRKDICMVLFQSMKMIICMLCFTYWSRSQWWVTQESPSTSTFFWRIFKELLCALSVL